MSRPKPNVLIEHTNKLTYKSEQVLASEGVWAVFYDAKPINLKTSNLLVNIQDQNTKRFHSVIQVMPRTWQKN
jgi:hypothetical protein